MEIYLNLWDLERLVKQYMGFNDLVVKEYHEIFEPGRSDCIVLKSSINTDCFILQWRTIASVKYCPYIYTFLPLIRPTKRKQSLVSRPTVLFRENVYRNIFKL